MKETVEEMEGYVDEIYSKKSNLIFYKSTGEEYIHENDMENRYSYISIREYIDFSFFSSLILGKREIQSYLFRK